ncbi:MAG: DegT/DnrJ/EryC1/StrS family aminotransferase, partial [Bdellovibrionales bacterium]|nr:DegT/DnrJ/EryC1/StrS family aminotransferase [Bdellovibrionales bacterium]
EMTFESHGPWYYQQLELGLNYRMTDIQASLGLSQMDRLKSYIDRRNEIAKIYSDKLSTLPIQLPSEPEGYVSARHLYVIRVDRNIRRKVFEGLREAGIGVNVHYIPIHTQPFYQTMTFHNGPFEESENYYAEAISIPMYPTLTTEEIQYVCDQVSRLVQPS